MISRVNVALRGLCLLVYVAAVVRLAGLMPEGLLTHAPRMAGLLLLLHVAELALVFRYVRLYRGPLLVSAILTLLFGLLHWKPLADAHASGSTKEQDDGN